MRIERAQVIVRGAVQGVGFRPFVYRLATELDLRGWVLNAPEGVRIEIEGQPPQFTEFLRRLAQEKPSRATIRSLETSLVDAVGYETFEIRSSGHDDGAKTALILPDLATCPECLAEIFDPGNRRYLYPFTNCTNCGPRFSIIQELPYDRPNTSMKQFPLCSRCAAEYHDPRDRRFHAQPTACPDCGPRLQLWDESGRVQSRDHAALQGAAQALGAGRIVALKGIGGFQLLVDARNDEAVCRLRARKRREEKPLALMYPALDHLRHDCLVSALEERLLLSPEAPIVLLRRHSPSADGAGRIARAVAPNNPYLGAMLPYSPLHHLLLRALTFPVVATSGNLRDEPICIDEEEALARLAGIADLFLVHDRPIARPVDDSLARVLLGRPQILRRARGYAPLPIQLSHPVPTVLAVGTHLKNTVALSLGCEVFLSQHLGDLQTEPAYAAFRRAAHDLPRLYAVEPELVACDLHPEYLTTQFAAGLEVPRVSVQHHYAHVLAGMAENSIPAPALGVSWDGSGLGLDRSVWGGEFLRVDETSFKRAAFLRPFPLPGGDTAIKEPRRSALGALFELFGDALFSRRGAVPLRYFTDAELPLLRRMLGAGVNTTPTSSAGRLFDVVASLVGLRQRMNFEGQAAMELEFAITPGAEGIYPFALEDSDAGHLVVDWRPMLRAILNDLRDREPVGVIAAKFHHTLAAMILGVAQHVEETRVILTGGCFQNRYLTERTVRLLEAAGFRPAWHQRVPPNDGGVALGQVLAAARARRPAAMARRARNHQPSAESLGGRAGACGVLL